VAVETQHSLLSREQEGPPPTEQDLISPSLGVGLEKLPGAATGGKWLGKSHLPLSGQSSGRIWCYNVGTWESQKNRKSKCVGWRKVRRTGTAGEK
jgi:hypothetical protein